MGGPSPLTRSPLRRGSQAAYGAAADGLPLGLPHELIRGQGPVEALALQPGGGQVAIAAGEVVLVVELATREVDSPPPPSPSPFHDCHRLARHPAACTVLKGRVRAIPRRGDALKLPAAPNEVTLSRTGALYCSA